MKPGVKWFLDALAISLTLRGEKMQVLLDPIAILILFVSRLYLG